MEFVYFFPLSTAGRKFSFKALYCTKKWSESFDLAIENGFEIRIGGNKVAQSNFRKCSTYIAAQVSALF